VRATRRQAPRRGRLPITQGRSRDTSGPVDVTCTAGDAPGEATGGERARRCVRGRCPQYRACGVARGGARNHRRVGSHLPPGVVVVRRQICPGHVASHPSSSSLELAPLAVQIVAETPSSRSTIRVKSLASATGMPFTSGARHTSGVDAPEPGWSKAQLSSAHLIETPAARDFRA